MALDPKLELDLNRDQMAARMNELAPKGFKLLSLSMYGDPKDARYAAVFDKRGGPGWEFALGFTVPDLMKLTNENKARDLYPSLVTATGGGGSKCRMSVIFEKLDPPKTRELTVNIGLEVFPKSVINRTRDGWILMSATIYDDAKNESLIAAVWERNSNNTAWNAFVETDTAQVQEHVNAELSVWTRLAFITSSTKGRLLILYRDDHFGPIGKGFVARSNMSREQFESQKEIWLKDGLHTICLQVSGLEDNRSFAAIAAQNDKLVGRVARASDGPGGGPAVPQIDAAVFDLMKRSNIRGAALAIVKGTKLVLARGYTWAEPDYPDVQPDTVFRLGSLSKLITALAIHQLAAEGRIKLMEKVDEVLPLKPPKNKQPANDLYLTGKVGNLLELSTKISPRYEPAGQEIVDEFKKTLPVTQEQIARFWITKPLETVEKKLLDDFGYFLAGQIVKKKRAQQLNETLMNAVERITATLQIKRIRSGRSRLLEQLSDEARYHARDLALNPSAMSKTKPPPLVPREYGDENLETMEASGGLSAAATDLARILAAMNAKPYTPIGRSAVDQMLKSAVDNSGGHGFDSVKTIDAVKEEFAFRKGGMLSTNQSGLYYSNVKDSFSYVVLWNGIHTGTGFEEDLAIRDEWYPKFIKVLDAAAAHTWPEVDRFNQFGMDTFAPTQDNFHWCKNCQGLFLGSSGGCPAGPAGSVHNNSESKNYVLMHSAALPYGEDNWRLCKKCNGLYFDGPGPKKCPSAPKHQPATNTNYSLVKQSPFNEHQKKWRRCKKCQGLFFKGKNVSVCPATGAHDDSESDDYSLAFS